MGWNYVTTFTGTWSITHLPGAALDADNQLWVMWSDSNKEYALTYFTQPLPPAEATLQIQDTGRKTEGSPCLAVADGQLLALWRGVGDHQRIHISPVRPGGTSLIPQVMVDANTVDGPTAAYLANPDVLFAAWRGSFLTSDPNNGDTTFWYSSVSQPGSDAPNAAGALSFSDDNFNSYYSPAVVAMPGGGVGVCWKGTGAPGSGASDDQLYFTAATSIDSPNWTPSAAVPITCTTSGGFVTPTALNRPSMALLSTPQAETIVVSYTTGSPTGSNQLSYICGTLQDGSMAWRVSPVTNGTVPLAAVLGNAVGGNMTNPVGVWATAPGSGSPLYLLVGDQAGGSIDGPLYLLAYSGE